MLVTVASSPMNKRIKTRASVDLIQAFRDALKKQKNGTFVTFFQNDSEWLEMDFKHNFILYNVTF